DGHLRVEYARAVAFEREGGRPERHHLLDAAVHAERARAGTTRLAEGQLDDGVVAQQCSRALDVLGVDGREVGPHDVDGPAALVGIVGPIRPRVGDFYHEGALL